MNRICRVEVRDRLIDPTAPEVWISVFSERQTATTEVHGRLHGPRCLYTSTIEVAYPLRPFPQVPEGLQGVSRRVIIPEASFWDPQSPFLYEGPIELWEDGQLRDQVTLSHGLKTLTLGPRGLRISSKEVAIRGLSCDSCSEEWALELRRVGYNTLLADLTEQTDALCNIADRVGFLVLGRVAADSTAIAQALALRRHPCLLGWLLDAALLADERWKADVEMLRRRSVGLPVGVEVKGVDAPPLTVQVDFLVCGQALLSSLPHLPPKLIALIETTHNGHDDSGHEDDAPDTGILGTIQR